MNLFIIDFTGDTPMDDILGEMSLNCILLDTYRVLVSEDAMDIMNDFSDCFDRVIQVDDYYGHELFVNSDC
jgi:hypothetical protein